MTRRHFIAIAAALKAERPASEGFHDPDRRLDYEYDQWRACVVAMADVCYASNGQFDRERFYAAAGLDR